MRSASLLIALIACSKKEEPPAAPPASPAKPASIGSAKMTLVDGGPAFKLETALVDEAGKPFTESFDGKVEVFQELDHGGAKEKVVLCDITLSSGIPRSFFPDQNCIRPQKDRPLTVLLTVYNGAHGSITKELESPRGLYDALAKNPKFERPPHWKDEPAKTPVVIDEAAIADGLKKLIAAVPPEPSPTIAGPCDPAALPPEGAPEPPAIDYAAARNGQHEGSAWGNPNIRVVRVYRIKENAPPVVDNGTTTEGLGKRITTYTFSGGVFEGDVAVVDWASKKILCSAPIRVKLEADKMPKPAADVDWKQYTRAGFDDAITLARYRAERMLLAHLIPGNAKLDEAMLKQLAKGH